MKHLPLLIALALAASIGCKQAYIPPAIANPPNYLVVEGFIENNGSDSTIFTLSHTIRLDSNGYTPEPGAKVIIEGADNSSYPLGEVGNGIYGAALLALKNSVSYRVHIITSGGKQYASDFVPLVADPPIDSINWVRLDNAVHQGIQIYANTHDPQNNTHYYRWEYQETWEFHSPFFATVKWVPGAGLENYSPNTTDSCWKSDRSANVLLASSTQLSQDVIYEAPLVLIPLGSQQITVRYSILVKQYALTKEAFNWWQILQKNTELIGSIFGVQPSANQGNIHCLTDTTETVIGYVGGGNTRSQRIFITYDQVQPWVFDSGCPDFKIPQDSTAWYYGIGFLPWYLDLGTGQVHIAYKFCVDCTLTGTNIRPSFW
jgi:hypothetical protein